MWLGALKLQLMQFGCLYVIARTCIKPTYHRTYRICLQPWKGWNVMQPIYGIHSELNYECCNKWPLPSVLMKVWWWRNCTRVTDKCFLYIALLCKVVSIGYNRQSILLVVAITLAYQFIILHFGCIFLFWLRIYFGNFLWFLLFALLSFWCFVI